MIGPAKDGSTHVRADCRLTLPQLSHEHRAGDRSEESGDGVSSQRRAPDGEP